MNPGRHRNRLAILLLGGIVALSPLATRAEGPSGQEKMPITGPSTPTVPEDGDATVQVPDRVGRLSKVQGGVSWHDGDAAHWDAAALNFPVATGDAFWTQPDARAELEIGPDTLAMNATTELDVIQLDDQVFGAAQPQGEVLIHLAGLGDHESWTIRTPRGVITLKAAGCYDIAAGDTEHTTQVSVIEGAAEVSATNLGLEVVSNQTAVIEGAEEFTGRVEALQDGAFVHEGAATLCRPAQPHGTTPPLAVLELSGGADLALHGTWAEAQDYGSVWYPEVAPSWVPYRQGYWGYFGAWGWTWVDNESWGFAPFHYGRWARINGRWAWIPGTYAREWHPVYAPALVGFFDTAGAPVAGGGTSGLVAWAPLGPHEAYYPWFRAPPAYVRAVNGPYVPDLAAVMERYQQPGVGAVQIGQFANVNAVTAVPAAVVASSQPVAALAQPIAADRLVGLHPVLGRAPVVPVAGAVGLSAGLAARLHIPGPAVPRAAPGPAFRTGFGYGVGPIGLRPPMLAVPAPRGGPARGAVGLPGHPGVRGPAPLPHTAPSWHDHGDGFHGPVPGYGRAPHWPAYPGQPRRWFPHAPFGPARWRFGQPEFRAPMQPGDYPRAFAMHLGTLPHLGPLRRQL
ncbi:MAG TPA: DUF6600 domain-containing protein [Acidisphaera sp.]|nr:DUF6600 domain-containing protein [Acidisphaera sp.]